jgi:hypothetical protein
MKLLVTKEMVESWRMVGPRVQCGRDTLGIDADIMNGVLTVAWEQMLDLVEYALDHHEYSADCDCGSVEDWLKGKERSR